MPCHDSRKPAGESGICGLSCGPADPGQRRGASVARPGISSARFRARAVFYHQAKLIVVLEAVAAFESKGCQRDVIHLLCPLVGLADQMVAALSSMFRQAVKRGKMPFNPCLGMDKAHTADPNSNREWYGDEWEFVRTNAPMEILIPCMLARYAGLAGQTIVGLNDKQFHDHPLTGKSVRYTRRKNKKATLLPVDVELQRFLAARTVHRADGLIAVRDDGTAWPSEKEMQTRVSHWLRDRERDGLIGSGTTLHGLRVSYAAWWKRSGATNSEVADLIGDASEAMGAHYTRHVDSEVNVVRAFERAGDRK
jgi:hypothetical protein